MKKSIHAFLCFIILSIGATAQQQTPFLLWQKTYGGSGDDEPLSIQQTIDSGYIIAGYSDSKNGDITGSHGNYDYWIVKADSKGKNLWQKTLGGSGDDEALSIKQTTDSGYIVAGYSYSKDGDVTGNHGSADYWIVKLDVNGNLKWQKTFGGSGDDIAFSIVQTKDTGYIISGYSSSIDGDVKGNHGGYDYWILKLDDTGNIQWQKTYGGTGDEFAGDIQQITDGSYILAGASTSNDGDVAGNHGGYDYWIIKIDASGNIQWQKTFGGSGDDEAFSIQQTNDGGYIVAGYSDSYDGDVTANHGSDYWILKLSAEGALHWQKTYGGSGGEFAYSIQQTADGYVVSGYSNSKDGDVLFHRLYTPFFNPFNGDYWILKLDFEGNIIWQKNLGGTKDDVAYSIRQTTDGGYIVVGKTYSYDENVTGNHGAYDYWIAKLSPEALNDSISINPYHTTINCSSANSVSCNLKNTNETYIVRLYQFGVLYDSAINVTTHIGFHNLRPGAYYATATNLNGVISYSKQLEIVPSPVSLNTTGVTHFNAQLNWTGFDCADNYTIQFRKLGSSEWRIEKTTYNVDSFILNNLHPSTTYVWRIASNKRLNGIKAMGKFSDSIIFTTASAITATNQNSITINNNAKTFVLNVSPNPAKNYFIINFKNDRPQKINSMLYDVNGKTIWTSGLVNANTLNGKQVNTSQFAKGVFYLKLMNEQGELIGSTKIVIAK